MISAAQVRAFADRGLEGDRFFRDSWAAAKRPDKAVSLIEQEVLEMAAAEHHVTIAGDKTTAQHYYSRCAVDRTARSRIHCRQRGYARHSPVRALCPFGEGFTFSGIFRALENRSGLKAAILSDGVIHTGDRFALQAAEKTP